MNLIKIRLKKNSSNSICTQLNSLSDIPIYIFTTNAPIWIVIFHGKKSHMKTSVPSWKYAQPSQVFQYINHMLSCPHGIIWEQHMKIIKMIFKHEPEEQCTCSMWNFEELSIKICTFPLLLSLQNLFSPYSKNTNRWYGQFIIKGNQWWRLTIPLWPMSWLCFWSVIKENIFFPFWASLQPCL